MSVRAETIANIFSAWLKRYSPPRIMADAPEIQKEERNTLLRVLLKFAPDRDYEGWLNRVLDRVEYQMKTRAWPTKGEIGAVCSNLAKEGHGKAQAQSEWTLDPAALAAKRMNEGQGVGDDWLFGRRCHELMATGEVSQDTLRAYRSAWYFSAKDLHGEEKARRMEQEMYRKHDASEPRANQRRVQNAPTYAPKTFGADDLEAAQ